MIRYQKDWIYLLLFLTIAILPDWIEIFIENIPMEIAMGELLRAYLFLLIPFLLFARWYKEYLLVVLFLTLILTPIDLGFMYLYSSRIDQMAFDVVMQTSIQESIEYTDGYRVYFMIGFFFNAFILYSLYKRINFGSKKALTLIAILALILIFLMAYRSSKLIYKDINFNIFSEILYTNFITTNSPWLIFKYALNHISNNKEFRIYKNLKKDFLFNAKKLDNEKQIHVLIIGETSRYDHWQINGYHRKNNPFLIKEKNIITLSNVITGAGATNWSVPLMICRATALNFDKTMSESSLIGAYKEAGYKTYWLSNQDWFPYLNIHVENVDEQYFLQKKTKHAYDGELLVKFKNILKDNEDSLIVLHTMGSHWRYDKRSPKKFDIFHPSIDRDSFIRLDDYKEKEKIINSYDNSIVYNDYFIFLVLNQIKKLKVPVTMTFISDHGENLYDTPENLFGHGRKVNPYVYRIPYFFWYSDKYQKKYPDKIKNAIINKDKKNTSSTNLFYSMLNVAQIEYKDINLNRSIFNNKYKEEKRIVLQGLNPIDYDEYINSKLELRGKIK